MALSKTATARLATRLQIVEAVTNIILQQLPATLGENAIETMPLADRRALRETMALYKSVIQAVRTRGSAAATAGDLTREDLSRLYFDAQSTMGRLAEAARKLKALSSDTFEDAAITASQKAVWQTKLTATLTELDAHIDAFPNE